jgi:ATP phosphoribosyltransferase regulatory subunit HisZ
MAYRIRQLENRLLDFITQSGYDLIEIPMLESADVFLTRAGDKIIDRMFTFEHRGRLLALRPEFTAAAARHYNAHFAGQTVRWQFAGVTFADDADETASNFQQHSIGVELIGQTGIAAESEVMGILAESTAKTGLQNWHLVSGHVGLQSHLLGRFGLDSRTARLLLAQREILKNPEQGKAYALEQINHVLAHTVEENALTDGIPFDNNTDGTQRMLDVLLDSTQYGTTMGGRTRKEIALRVLQKRQRALEQHQIVAALDFLEQWVNFREALPTAFGRVADFIESDDILGQHLLSEWQQTIEQVQRKTGAENILIQPNLARNWEYYTGIVFGIRANSGEYVAGGGRYDELIGLLGGQKTPAAGFAFYLNRLLRELAEA